jgi:hypothetical protein
MPQSDPPLVHRVHRRLAARGAADIRMALADVVHMLARQLHRLALAQQDRSGLVFKLRLAAGAVLLCVFTDLY